MMSQDVNNPMSAMDQALDRRLRRVGARPVDTSRVDALIRGAIPRQAGARSPRMWLGTMRLAAAGIALFVIGAAAILTLSGNSALASPTELARMHEELVSGRAAVVQVDSVEAANRVLAGESGAAGGAGRAPEVPAPPAEHVMACCVQKVKNTKVACVLLNAEGGPVSMMVARAREMHCRAEEVVSHGGVKYHVSRCDDLNMVMTEREGRFVCLVGKQPAQQLMEIAAGLKY